MMDWTGRKVLVTGGGFIENHLLEVLFDLSTEVTALVRYTSEEGFRKSIDWFRNSDIEDSGRYHI